MIGWLLALLLKLSHAEWCWRLPVTLLPSRSPREFISCCARGRNEGGARRVRFMLLPANVWSVFITTDTPLISFLRIGVRILAGNRPALAGWQALAESFSGSRFSRSISRCVGTGLRGPCCALPARPARLRALALVVLCSLPFAFVNSGELRTLLANLMFNLYNRHETAGWSERRGYLRRLVLYVLSPGRTVAARRSAGPLPPRSAIRRHVFFAAPSHSPSRSSPCLRV